VTVNARARASTRALLLAACCLACGQAPLDANLLIITLDTTRPDHLGCYGHERNTSPEIDRVAADGVVYTRAFSTSSWTLPAHASLFTGKFPWSHGARIDPDGPVSLADAVQGDDFLRSYRASGLAPDELTLAEILAAHGFTTGAVVGGPWMKRVFGLDRGFQHYDDDGIDTVSGRKAADITDAALAWLDRHERERFFLFLNYYDPHAPYRDPEGYGIRFLSPQDRQSKRRIKLTTSAIGALYDGEIRYTDDHVGRLVESLRRRGLYDDAWIIITSDHGELLYEHEQMGHGLTLYQQEIRIPLIIKFPADAGRSGGDDAPIQLTDVFVMVLEGLGLPLPSRVRGHDGLLPVFAEVYPQEWRSLGGDWRVLLDGDLKLHWNSRGQHRLFDLAADPGEESNLAPNDPQRVQAMESALERFLAGLPPPAPRGPPQTLDPQTQEALRNLGYLE
jgi:arylsulfatase A-like enzyme